jgi:hypothetical protein
MGRDSLRRMAECFEGVPCKSGLLPATPRLTILRSTTMVPPCQHCGATRTESVRHRYPWRYAFARGFGYRLRLCGRCNHLRLVREEFFEKTHSEPLADPLPPPVAEPPPESPTPESPQEAATAETQVVCPYCGSPKYRRSKRRWYERLVGRPPMARCRVCYRRFPYPRR